MKTKIFILTLIVCCLQFDISAQFNTYNTNFGRTDVLIRGIGIGNYPIGVNPAARLHINNFYLNDPTNVVLGSNMFRTDGLIGFPNQWQMFTGPTVGTTTQKFRVFTTLTQPWPNFTLVNDQNVTLEASQRDMIFNAGGNIERMRILGQDQVLNLGPWFAIARAGNVGIETPHPLTLLHMGGEGASGAGWREWMDIGTYYASRGGFDNMYVGLRTIDNDQNEAIISFGNNPTNNPNFADRMRFVFTAAPGNGIASTQFGLELARFWVDNNSNGRMGIGDFFTPNTEPQNTLEIMASAGSPYWGQPGGTSGLRFTFLNSNSATIINPGLGILSVDENGDVIYVDASTIGGVLSLQPTMESQLIQLPMPSGVRLILDWEL